MSDKTPEQIMRELQAFFPAEVIQWRAGPVSEAQSRAIALPYIDAGTIQDRLDAVLGVGGWAVHYDVWGERSVKCRLSCKIGADWVEKEDGAQETERESVKGGFSGAFKRAASVWGIGRYLRRIPKEWVKAVKRGNSWYLEESPAIPPEFLPENDTGARGAATRRPTVHPPGADHQASETTGDGKRTDLPTSTTRRTDSPAPTGKAAGNPQIARFIRELGLKLGLSDDAIKARCGRHGAETPEQLSAPDAAALHEELRKELKDKEARR